MKITVEVANKREGELVKKAMSDAAAHAFIVMIGGLLSLESDRARHRVMTYIKDYLEEHNEQQEEIK